MRPSTSRSANAHLLRELDAPKEPAKGDWERFGRRVRRLFKDALRLRAERDQSDELAYGEAVARLERRAAAGRAA